MGVPAFYRWLTEKYPKVVQDVLEERIHVDPISGRPLPFDATGANPSNLECDNLYIDMNGIIHPCSHPENGPQPKNEQEMYENVCRYVDRLVYAIRPRKLLYLAIDGVAPRAKMNQQRARRFRSAQEARELKELETEIRKNLPDDEKVALPKDPWDSNVITPGTPFMLLLSEYIRFYIRRRFAEDPAWKNIRVIFSDASIPGEGEHKIMNHVRLQRAQPGYDPNTVHVLHGLDADLIMLALATHEAHFYISREQVLFGRKSRELEEERQQQSGFVHKQQAFNDAVGPIAMQLPVNQHKPLQRLSIPILREYLAFEFYEPCLNPARLPFRPDFERLIDDVVFCGFFIGNDFLPHSPSLEYVSRHFFPRQKISSSLFLAHSIRDGALDYLFNVYKRVLPGLGDYITSSGGNVNLSAVDVLLAEVGSIEDHVFQMRHDNEEREKARRNQSRGRAKQAPLPPPVAQGRAARILAKADGDQHHKLGSKTIQVSHKSSKANTDAAKELKSVLASNSVGKKRTADEIANDDEDVEMAIPDAEPSACGVKTDPSVVGAIEDEFDVDDEDEDDGQADPLPDPEATKRFKEKVKVAQQKKLDQYSKTIEDKVRLHESGWRDRYYTDKCKADDVKNHGGREHLFRSYIQGLIWVMKYYYVGCPSWKWYYPFHYAPFASDLRNIERFSKDCKSFELNTPFNPVEQLMAVLPSDSSHAVPKAARWLMSDEESPIIDFYPKDVPVDPNGKAMPWLWVVLLPFIDEERLLSAFTPTMEKWSKSELLCNARGLDDGYLYIHRTNSLSEKLGSLLKDEKGAAARKVKLSNFGCHGFSGSVRPPLDNEVHAIDEDVTICPPPGADAIDSPANIFGDRIEMNQAVCVAFSEPRRLAHKSVVLPGVVFPKEELTAADKVIRRPRLNRGGGTIANLGVSNGQSHRAGYGSMNISSRERELAQRTGRGAEMYQTGTRAWGAMEPAPKRRQLPPGISNPFASQYGGPHHQNGSGWGHRSSQSQGRNHGGYEQPHHQQQNGYNQGTHRSYPAQYQNPHQSRNYRQPPQHTRFQQNGSYHQSQPNHGNYHGNHGRDQRQGHDFRSHNTSGARGQGPRRANDDVMNSLREQLSSTLNRNRGNRTDNRRR